MEYIIIAYDGEDSRVDHKCPTAEEAIDFIKSCEEEEGRRLILAEIKAEFKELKDLATP